MSTIQLDKKCAIELIASDDDMRRDLAVVRIGQSGSVRVACASDGRRLVVVKVGPNTDCDAELFIPRAMFSKIRKGFQTVRDKARAFFGLDVVTMPALPSDIVDGKASDVPVTYIDRNPMYFRLPNSVDIRFPKFADVFSNVDYSQAFALSLNPKYLYELGEAMGSGAQITLLIDRNMDSSMPIVAVPCGPMASERIGVLMPIRGDYGERNPGSMANAFIQQLKGLQ